MCRRVVSGLDPLRLMETVRVMNEQGNVGLAAVLAGVVGDGLGFEALVQAATFGPVGVDELLSVAQALGCSCHQAQAWRRLVPEEEAGLWRGRLPWLVDEECFAARGGITCEVLAYDFRPEWRIRDLRR